MATTPKHKAFRFMLVFMLACSATGSYFSQFENFNNFSADQYQKEKGNMVQYREGDVIIGVLVRVHGRGRSICNDILIDGIQEIETVNMLVDMINNDSTILSGIKLGTVMIDTCDVDTHALERLIRVLLPLFFAFNSNEREKIPLFTGIVGASSSGVSLQTASLLQAFKIPQVSPWSTHPELSDKNRFPYFFRTVPPDSNQATAIVRLLVEQDWRYVSIVYEDDFYGLQGFREVQSEALKFGVCFASTIAIPRNPNEQHYIRAVNKLWETPSAKVVVVFAKRVDAERLIRAANNDSRTRAYFKWIGTDGWTEQLPDRHNDYLESLDGAVGLNPINQEIKILRNYIANQGIEFKTSSPWSNRNKNPWFAEFLTATLSCNIEGIKSSENRLCNPNDRVNASTFTKMQNVADAVYSIVLSLDKYLHEVCGSSSSICLKVKNTTGTNYLAQNVFERMKNITFTGINGNNFTFDKRQDGPAEFNLLEFDVNRSEKNSKPYKWNRQAQFIDGDFRWSNNKLLAENVFSRCSEPCNVGQAQVAESSVCCWICQPCLEHQYVENQTACIDCPRGFFPASNRKECSKIEVYISGFNDPYGIGSTVISVIGLVIAIIVALIFYKNRKTAIVKASGKESCIFVLVGSTFCFLNSFVLRSQPNNPLCVFSRIFVAIGPTLMYASIITKTIRILVIFHSQSLLSKQVKLFLLPKYQVLVTILFLFIQLCVVSLWFVIGSPKATELYPDKKSVYLACTDINGLVVLVGFAYPFILIIACTVLATLNRKVPTGFNETQYIGFTMYTTCIIWLGFIPVFIANPDNISLKIATLAICLNLSAITVLVCLYGHRCFTILFKPEKNTSKAVMSSGQIRETTSQATKTEVSKTKRESCFMSTPGNFKLPTTEIAEAKMENHSEKSNEQTTAT